MEIQLLTILCATGIKLSEQGVLVNTYAHRRELERVTEYIVPDKYVTIETMMTISRRRAPIVIVGSSSIVWLTTIDRTTYAHYEHSAIFLGYLVLTLLWSEVGILGCKVFRVDKMDSVRKLRTYLWVMFTDDILSAFHCAVDTCDDILEILDVA